MEFNKEDLLQKYNCELHTEDAYLLINIISKAELEDLIIDKIKDFNKIEESKDATYREIRRRLALEGKEENSQNLDNLINSDKDLKNRLKKLEENSDIQLDLAKTIIKELLKKIVYLKKDINTFVAKVYSKSLKEIEGAKIDEFMCMLMGIFKSPSFGNVVNLIKVFFS